MSCFPRPKLLCRQRPHQLKIPCVQAATEDSPASRCGYRKGQITVLSYDTPEDVQYLDGVRVLASIYAGPCKNIQCIPLASALLVPGRVCFNFSPSSCKYYVVVRTAFSVLLYKYGNTWVSDFVSLLAVCENMTVSCLARSEPGALSRDLWDQFCRGIGIFGSFLPGINMDL